MQKRHNLKQTECQYKILLKIINKQKVHTKFCLETPKRREHTENLEAGRKIIL
jgi:hypothetical protein